MKKYKKGDREIFNILVNKQLEKYGVTVDDVKNNPLFKEPTYTKWDKFLIKLGLLKEKKKINWYQYYTFDSEQEYQAWKDFCIKFITTRISPKISLKQAETEFAWLDLSVGLKQKYKTKYTIS